MNYEIILDNREHKLIQMFPDSKVSQLDIGDILYINTDIQETVCIIERKTLDDLSSSIMDGRYKEQKQRLLASQKKIVYIIEGLSKNNRGLKYSTLQSAILNMQFRDNITVVRTKNIEETASMLIMMKDKLKFINSEQCSPIAEYTPVMSLKKKNNMTKDVVYLNQLSCIPGVSHKIAKDIICVFPTLLSIVTAYSNLETTKEKEKLLCSIDGIGSVISARVYNFLV